MKELLPLTPEQLARAEKRLRHPKPGGKIADAREYGIDLTTLMANLRLTPAERAREMWEATQAADGTRGIARRTS